MAEYEILFYDDTVGIEVAPHYGDYNTAMVDWIKFNRSKITSIVSCAYRKHLIVSEETKTKVYVDAIAIKYEASSELPSPMECKHSSVAEEILEEATCLKPGRKRKYCSACGVTLSVEEIPVLEHTPTEEEVRTATCHVKGQTNTVCSECGQVLSTVYTELAPHTPTKEVIKEPTETEPGLTYTVCSVCNDLLDRETVPPTGK